MRFGDIMTRIETTDFESFIGQCTNFGTALSELIDWSGDISKKQPPPPLPNTLVTCVREYTTVLQMITSLCRVLDVQTLVIDALTVDQFPCVEVLCGTFNRMALTHNFKIFYIRTFPYGPIIHAEVFIDPRRCTKPTII